MNVVLSNSSLGRVRENVRGSAIADFSYFANTVVGARLDPLHCDAAQECVQEEKDFYLRTTNPRKFAQTLAAWLNSRGCAVLADVPNLPAQEMLSWLELDAPCHEDEVVTLVVASDGVNLRWLKREVAQ